MMVATRPENVETSLTRDLTDVMMTRNCYDDAPKPPVKLLENDSRSPFFLFIYLFIFFFIETLFKDCKLDKVVVIYKEYGNFQSNNNFPPKLWEFLKNRIFSRKIKRFRLIF
ncbi:hypothetical protein HanIR_Chr10g0497581 [Helianthus annuus]|nr:hypothetical protein HanIR_Chr10g0497581 [Helianthus annuus]